MPCTVNSVHAGKLSVLIAAAYFICVLHALIVYFGYHWGRLDNRLNWV